MADLSQETAFGPMANTRIGNPTFGIIPSASPFIYVAPYPMAIIVSGGTVSLVSYGRGSSLTAMGLTSGIIELNMGDSLRIAYVTAPTITAIPR